MRRATPRRRRTDLGEAVDAGEHEAPRGLLLGEGAPERGLCATGRELEGGPGTFDPAPPDLLGVPVARPALLVVEAVAGRRLGRCGEPRLGGDEPISAKPWMQENTKPRVASSWVRVRPSAVSARRVANSRAVRAPSTPRPRISWASR